MYNVLVDIGKMETNILLYVMGLTGDDYVGYKILDLLCKNGINTDFIYKTKDANTPYTDVITVKSNERRTFFHYR